MVGAMRVFVILLLALPAATALLVALLGHRRRCAIRWICLSVTIVDAILASILAVNLMRHRVANGGPEIQGKFATFQPEFVPGAPHVKVGPNISDPQVAARAKADAEDKSHTTTWNLLRFGEARAVQFYLGVDGINVWLVLLTAILMVPSVLVSWRAIEQRTNEYYAWLLALGAAMTGVFLAFDIILFYVFFELTLVPLFFLIGIWGGPERRYAARKFFVYTLAGSLVTLLGLLAVVVVCYQHSLRETKQLTFAIPDLVQIVNANLALADSLPIATERLFWQNFQFWVFLALLTGFAIKVPLFPVHTWLPLAHTEAPTAGSVLLAGVLLKLGAYGILRFCLPLAPDACLSVGVPLVGTLAVVGILYGAFCALAQNDIKKMVAYSSVSHLGFCMLGMFALNSEGLAGSLLQMINHGLSTGGLFLLVGMLYERYHTRQMADYSGMASRLGLLSACMVFIVLSSVGLPGLNGFVGEALVFFGMFSVRPDLAVWATAGILLGAWYLLSMVRQVFFGKLKEPHHDGAVGDLDVREIFALAPIMVLCVVLGVYPQPVLDTAKPDLDVIVNILKQRQ